VAGGLKASALFLAMPLRPAVFLEVCLVRAMATIVLSGL
jgi:hypothetical protein